MNIFTRQVKRLHISVASHQFFYLIVGLLVFEALWLALSGKYPMAFDEDFHFGIIKLYAGHLNPFWNAHPPGADVYGPITRDPSYLYHYLMSFPYRFLRVVTDNTQLQIICLRFINIGLLSASLPLYRKLLLRTGASKKLVHIVLLLFVLVPIVPLLAAQINYDNLIVPMTALSLLLTLRVADSFQANHIDVQSILKLIVVCLLSSLVKYAYLPIFIVIVCFLVVRIWQVHGSRASFGRAFSKGWQYTQGFGRWAAVGLLVISSVLFVERYGVNIARFHTPVPDCAQVLLYDQCQHYGPWIRDHDFAKNKPVNADKSPVNYTQHWLYGMWFRSFFAVDGPATLYQTRGPLTLPGISVILLTLLSVIAFLGTARQVWRRYNTSSLWLLSAGAAVYVIVLWLTEYQLFLETGQPVAINGRYLLPILPVFMLLGALSIKQLLRRYIRVTNFVAILAVFTFVWGGGFLTYALRSNDAWYWPLTPLRSGNHILQRYVGPAVPGNYNPIQYLH